jgi:hypothetical protein
MTARAPWPDDRLRESARTKTICEASGDHLGEESANDPARVRACTTPVETLTFSRFAREPIP